MTDYGILGLVRCADCRAICICVDECACGALCACDSSHRCNGCTDDHECVAA